jgi:hypothetical protein
MDGLRATLAQALADRDLVIRALDRLRPKLISMLSADSRLEYEDNVVGELAELCATLTAMRGRAGLAEDLIDRNRGFGRPAPSRERSKHPNQFARERGRLL